MRILFDIVDVSKNHLVGLDELRLLLQAINIECSRLGLTVGHLSGVYTLILDCV